VRAAGGREAPVPEPRQPSAAVRVPNAGAVARMLAHLRVAAIADRMVERFGERRRDQARRGNNAGGKQGLFPSKVHDCTPVTQLDAPERTCAMECGHAVAASAIRICQEQANRTIRALIARQRS